MLRTRFFEIFYLLNAGDRKRFEEMVYSPYFNKNSRVIKLWEHLKANGEEDENLSKANIAKAVFGTERFSDANFRMVIASFVKLVEEYLLHEEYAKNEMERKIRLLEIFQGKNLQKSFRMYLNEIENELDKVKKKDSTYYYRKYF
ncbi:MAG: hypothetical protein K8I03_02005, partial [Ignavibacteria bacterium]|nr:hypothetical protein [Ignavibacteria bacterium]